MNHANIARKIRQIAFLGNHLPRQCGIATFTTDLSSAMAAEFCNTDCFVVAMNDPGKQYAYPPRVRFEVAESDIASYRRAADFLNSRKIDVVSVQHEYGIFGGKAGSYLLDAPAQFAHADRDHRSYHARQAGFHAASSDE